MKRLLLVLVLLYSLICFGQREERFTALEKTSGLDKIKTYTILRRPGKPEIITTEDVISLKIDEVSEVPVPLQEALKKHGVRGVIIINYKPGIKLASLATLLKNKIPDSDMKLMVYVDNIKYHSEARNIITVPENVKSATVTTDGATKERYIDVRTGRPLHPRKYKIMM